MAGTRLMLPSVIAAAALMIVGCAHRPPPPLHSSSLVVQRSAGGFRPLVRAKVAGHPMTLLVDTGALKSMLPSGFARAHNLVTKSSGFDRLTEDSNGNVAQLPLLANVPVQFEGEAKSGTLDFLMIASDATEEGILAPQDIVRPGWVVVIDIGHEEVRYEEEDAALKRLVGEASPLREVDFHRCLNEGFFDRSHRIVNTNINGVSASMLLDTGASRTVLARNNPALRSMLEVQGYRSTSKGVISTGTILMVENVRVLFSEISFVLPVMVNPTAHSCWQGALGADVLRHCTLVWGWSSLWSACRTPAEPLAALSTAGATRRRE